MPVSKVAAVAGALVVACSVRLLGASELSWEGGPCTDREQVLFELERALGMPLSTAGELALHVLVERSSTGLEARLRVAAPGAGAAADERVLAAASCEELTETLAVAISLAIGRSLGDAQSLAAAPPHTEAPQERVSAAPTDAKGSQSAAAAGSNGPRASAIALLVADAGSLPRAALGAGVGVELGWKRLRVQLSAAMFYPQRARWPAGADVGADLGLTMGAARACMPALSSPSWSLTMPWCLGMELGLMDGAGYGVAGARSREMLWIAPRAEVGLSWAPAGSPLSVETTLGLALPLNRDQFVFDGMGAIHRPDRIAGRLGAQLNFGFQ